MSMYEICPAGYTATNGCCTFMGAYACCQHWMDPGYDMLNGMCTGYYDGGWVCPSEYTYNGGSQCYRSKTVFSGYVCGSGEELSGNMCIQKINADIVYFCPNGGSLSGSTCIVQCQSASSTATSTVSSSGTSTETATGTGTQTQTQTSTQTSTQTITGTATQTSTQTSTQTITGTATKTSTQTSTQTITGTSTETSTGTSTQTSTQTITGTATETQTQTQTTTPIVSPSGTATETSTQTSTGIPKPSTIENPSKTPTPSFYSSNYYEILLLITSTTNVFNIKQNYFNTSSFYPIKGTLFYCNSSSVLEWYTSEKYYGTFIDYLGITHTTYISHNPNVEICPVYSVFLLYDIGNTLFSRRLQHTSIILTAFENEIYPLFNNTDYKITLLINNGTAAKYTPCCTIDNSVSNFKSSLKITPENKDVNNAIAGGLSGLFIGIIIIAVAIKYIYFNKKKNKKEEKEVIKNDTDKKETDENSYKYTIDIDYERVSYEPSHVNRLSGQKDEIYRINPMARQTIPSIKSNYTPIQVKRLQKNIDTYDKTDNGKLHYIENNMYANKIQNIVKNTKK